VIVLLVAAFFIFRKSGDYYKIMEPSRFAGTYNVVKGVKVADNSVYKLEDGDFYIMYNTLADDNTRWTVVNASDYAEIVSTEFVHPRMGILRGVDNQIQDVPNMTTSVNGWVYVV
jgi:hypothetical protein